MQTDTSWKKLLYVWTPELLSFHINAIHDQLPAPANLKLWGKINLGLCQLCHHRHCTLLHIMNGCNHSLQDGRYNWRHDQTLRANASGLAPYVEEANTRKGPTLHQSSTTSSQKLHSIQLMEQPTEIQSCHFQRPKQMTYWRRLATGCS